MRALLDTHVFLWWIADDRRLSAQARAIIADGTNTLFLSVASAWEIAIKVQIGRLTLPDLPARSCPVRWLPTALRACRFRSATPWM